ncbi:hypothetical protein [Saccharibacillus endophyticus]|uniref:DUF1573 domain-containing protein n=1 Tax=Saccharibacillus endophyticus TaxID=2060666 RepID=A0ABQ1ZUJ9_9BACL|nr:hypothetical protein [Saccharibacillus endophyticus]GGH76974.1 hypothetical protein GCM10007362_20030 [Saccharibacillus endophyticus]
MNLESTARTSPKAAPWIGDPKRFRKAMILTGILTFLSIRYPGVRPLYEEALLLIRLPLTIPIAGNGSIMYANLIFIGFAFWALYLIWDSLNRHRIIFCLALLWLLPMLGKSALLGYQATIPPGVYAVAVDQEQTACNIDLEKGVATGGCSFVVTNRGSQPIDLKSTISIDIELHSRGTYTLDIPLQDTHIDTRSIEVIGAHFTEPIPELADITSNMSWNNALETGTLKLTMNDGKRERVWGN